MLSASPDRMVSVSDRSWSSHGSSTSSSVHRYSRTTTDPLVKVPINGDTAGLGVRGEGSFRFGKVLDRLG